MTHAAWSPVEGDPFFVAAVRGSVTRALSPRLTAIRGAPNVATIAVHQQAEIEESPGLIGVGYRVAAEDIVLQNAGERPMHASIGAVAIAGLPEVGCVSVKLPPTDGYFVAVGWVDRNRRLVRGVADDVVPIRIDVDLIADERAELRNHLW